MILTSLFVFTFPIDLFVFLTLFFRYVKTKSKHTATVNSLSVAKGGEWIASASDDGRVVIASLYTDQVSIKNGFKRKSFFSKKN